MTEPKRVTKLMQRFLQRPCARLARVRVRAQARKRDQSHTPMALGQSKDEVEAFDIEIEVGHAKHALACMAAKHAKECIRLVLPSIWMVGRLRRLFAVGQRRVEAGPGKVLGQNAE
jgi:hypothetical protein